MDYRYLFMGVAVAFTIFILGACLGAFIYHLGLTSYIKLKGRVGGIQIYTPYDSKLKATKEKPLPREPIKRIVTAEELEQLEKEFAESIPDDNQEKEASI